MLLESPHRTGQRKRGGERPAGGLRARPCGEGRGREDRVDVKVTSLGIPVSKLDLELCNV